MAGFGFSLDLLLGGTDIVFGGLDKLDKRIKALTASKAKIEMDGGDITRVDRQITDLTNKVNHLKEIDLTISANDSAIAKARGKLFEGIALGASVAIPIKAAIDFESSMADVKKVVDFTDEGLKEFEDGLISMSRSIPLSMNELARIAASGGQMGIAQDRILQFTEISAKMATAFDMSAAEAGDAIGKLMNVYSLGLDETERLGDTINYLSNSMATTPAAITEVMARIGGSARIFGLTTDQSAALAASFTALGKSPQIAATSINTLLNRLNTGPDNGKAFCDALTAIGMNAKDLKEKINVDAQGALSEFLSALQQIDKADQMSLLKDLFGTGGADDMAVLIGGIDQYSAALKSATDIGKDGSMNDEFAKRSATTENSLKLLSNAFTELSVSLGLTMLPTVRDFASGISKAAQFVAELGRSFPTLTGFLYKVIAALIGVTSALALLKWGALATKGAWLSAWRFLILITPAALRAKIALLWTATSAKISAFAHNLFSAALWRTRIAMIASATATGVMTAAQWLFNAALWANPLTLIIAGVAALAAGMVYLYNTSEPVRQFFDGLWESLRSGASAIYDFFKPAFDWLGDSLGWIWDKFAGFAEWIGLSMPNVEMPAMPELPAASLETPASDYGGGFSTPALAAVGSGGSTSITININNPQMANGAGRDALAIDVRRAVDEALRARADSRNNLTFGDTQ
ncbi:MAG: phage tail tape measure protein [Helicobacteraceae bacterium]|jgi:TP901 family phage tail tape measure protein|nr:phage tail tape measure protein [Helicobacteraceae bacterium]